MKPGENGRDGRRKEGTGSLCLYVCGCQHRRLLRLYIPHAPLPLGAAAAAA